MALNLDLIIKDGSETGSTGADKINNIAVGVDGLEAEAEALNPKSNGSGLLVLHQAAGIYLRDAQNSFTTLPNLFTNATLSAANGAFTFDSLLSKIVFANVGTAFIEWSGIISRPLGGVSSLSIYVNGVVHSVSFDLKEAWTTMVTVLWAVPVSQGDDIQLMPRIGDSAATQRLSFEGSKLKIELIV